MNFKIMTVEKWHSNVGEPAFQKAKEAFQRGEHANPPYFSIFHYVNKFGEIRKEGFVVYDAEKPMNSHYFKTKKEAIESAKQMNAKR